MIYFVIPEIPVGKERPRKGKFGMYTPKKTRNFEHRVKMYFKASYPRHKLINKPISVRLMFYAPPPKNWSKKKKDLIIAKYTLPDLDNYIKAVLDGMNGAVYTDDRLVSQITAAKFYCIKYGIQVWVNKLEDKFIVGFNE